MARRRKIRKTRASAPLVTEERRDSLQRWIDHVNENRLLYVVCAVFIVVCAIGGGAYSIRAAVGGQELATDYAQAVLDIEDPEARVGELERVSGERGVWSAESLYVMAESAIRARQYDRAEEAFRRVREEYPDSSYVPRSVEGLAFLAENAGDFEKALRGYQEVSEKWGGTFAGRCQSFNIGRVKEALEDLDGAIEAYQAQVELFPGSVLAGKSQKALGRLQDEHPELFPEEAPPGEVASTDQPVADQAGTGSVSEEGAVAEEGVSATELAEGSETVPEEAGDVEPSGGSEDPGADSSAGAAASE